MEEKEKKVVGGVQYLILKLHANRINIISALLREEEQLDEVPFKYCPFVSGMFV